MINLLSANSVFPSQLIHGFFIDKAFLGSHRHDPFSFRKFGLKTIELKRNGNGIPYPAQEFELEWEGTKENPMYSREYIIFLMNARWRKVMH